VFIDIHVHTRRIPGPARSNGQTYATPDELLARYDAIGVERAVVLPGVSPECAHVPQSNEEVIEVSAQSGGRFIPFCNVDPRAESNAPDADLGRLLEHYRGLGCKGVGEVTANLPIDDGRVQNLFACCQAVGLPLTFHLTDRIGGTYGLYDEPNLPGLRRALAAHPNLIFLGHSQPFWAQIAPLAPGVNRAGYPTGPVADGGAVPELMRRYPNLYGDLSAHSGYNALARDEDHAAAFIEEFQDRLLFGTDICAPDTPTPLVDLLCRLRDEGRISERAFQRIARGNAIRLLDLA